MQGGIFYFSSAALVFNPLIYGFNNYLMAVKHRFFGNIYSFLIECGIPVTVTFIMMKMFSYHGAWIAKPVSLIILCLIALAYIMRQEGKTFTDKLLLLPEDFGSSPEKEIYASAETMEEVMEMSVTAVNFAENNGAEVKRANVISLVIEEMAGNVIRHGFGKNKSACVNMRLISKNDDLILRLRDEGAAFDPIGHYDKIFQ